jgi:hypothetical protein
MTTVLVIATAVAAGSLCPALMWWNARRGQAACCAPRRSGGSAELEAAHRQQSSLEARVAALRGGAPEAGARSANGELSGDARG